MEIKMQGSKPWRYTGKEENMQREDIKMLVEKWWEIYNDESLDYKKQQSSSAAVAAVEAAQAVDMQPFIEALSEAAGSFQYVNVPSAA